MVPTPNASAPEFLLNTVPSFSTADSPFVSQPSLKESYQVGDKVIHTSYGKGDVIKVEGNKITVRFKEEFGIKKLIVGFKAFRKLKEGEE